MKDTVKSIQLITNRFSSQHDPYCYPGWFTEEKMGGSLMTSEGMPMVRYVKKACV